MYMGHGVCVRVRGLSGGQLSQMLHESILQLLTKATPSLLRAAGRQALLDGGGGVGGVGEKRINWRNGVM